MPNAIKYNTSAETLALKKGNFYIGTGAVGKGPTSETGYYNGITPPSGGYTIYLNKESGGPSIYTVSNDAQLISLTNSIAGQSYTGTQQCFNYFYSQTDKLLVNQDYPSNFPYIVLDGLIMCYDAGITMSYPTTGTTWFDINGLGSQNNGTLTNGLTFENGGIRFDGTDDYVPFNSVQVKTVQVWAKADVGSANGLQGIICNSVTSDGSLRFEGGTFRNANLADQNDMQIGYPTDLWINGVKNPGNSVGGYYAVPNGRTLNQDFFVSVKADPTRYTSTVTSLSHNFLNRRFKGMMYSVYLYDKWLSDEEILQNYDATKGRFGL
jgi:hypothetical protein